jgi:hypothetical protein
MAERKIFDGHVTWWRGDVEVLNEHDESRSTSNVWWAEGGHDDYDSRCGACYFGHGHSLAYHNAALDRLVP